MDDDVSIDSLTDLWSRNLVSRKKQKLKEIQKDEWIKYIGFYGLSGVIGLVFFLITYFVPAKKNTSLKPLHPFLMC